MVTVSQGNNYWRKGVTGTIIKPGPMAKTSHLTTKKKTLKDHQLYLKGSVT